MKTYRAIELTLVVPSEPQPAETDFGKAAAVLHRVMKASRAGAPQAAGARRGAFKSVTVPSAGPSLVAVESTFALARMRIDGEMISPRVPAGEALGVMAAYGLRRMTVFYGHKQGADPVVYLYMPLAKGEDLLSVLPQVKAKPAVAAALFLDLCRQVKALHRAGFYHGDLKPENVMVDRGNTPRAQLIDFGLLRRAWRPSGMGTLKYAVYGGNFAFALLHVVTSSVGTETRRAFYAALKDQAAKFQTYATHMTTMASDQGMRNYAHLAGDKGKPFRSCIGSVQIDNAALVFIAAEMGLLTEDTAPDFLACIEHAYEPAYFKRLKAGLRARFAPNVVKAHALAPLPAASELLVEVRDDNTLSPEGVANELTRLVRENAATGEAAAGRGDDAQAMADAQAIFKAFSAIKDVYAAPGTRDVNPKVAVLTALIDLASWSTSRAELNECLSKIFFVALVNRKSGWNYRKYTNSFTALLTRMNRQDLGPVAARWLAVPERTPAAVYDAVINAVRGLCPAVNERLTARGSTKLKAELRDEVFMDLVRTSVPNAPGPNTRANAAAQAPTLAANQKAAFLTRFGPAGGVDARAAAVTQRVDVTAVDPTAFVAALQTVFTELYGGDRKEDVAAFAAELKAASAASFCPSSSTSGALLEKLKAQQASDSFYADNLMIHPHENDYQDSLFDEDEDDDD